MDTCILCDNNFVVIIATGLCIISEIPNCLKISISIDQYGQSNQLCFECASNFIVSQDSKTCVMQLKDYNCLLENEDNQCLECKTGYFLTFSGDCIKSIGQSLCSISNCIKLHPKSNPEELLCDSCASNYSLDAEFKCSFIDPDSDIEVNKHFQGEDVTQLKPTENDTIDSFMLFTIIASIIVLLIGLGVICRIIQKKINHLQNKQTSNFREHVEESKRSNSEIQMSSIYLNINNVKSQSQHEGIAEEEGQQIIYVSKSIKENIESL